jgi:hypothetical protein
VVEATTALATNWHVAIWLLAVPTLAVGAVGVPVRDGDATGARDVSEGWT